MYMEQVLGKVGIRQMKSGLRRGMKPRLIVRMILVLLLAAPAVQSPKAAAAGQDEFDALRLKWLSQLTGTGDYNVKDKAIDAYIKRISKVTNAQGTGILDTLNLDGSAGLWPDLQSTTNPAHITAQFKRIGQLALVYATRGAPLYQNEALGNDIEAAMQWMYDNRYNERSVRYGNWWEWEIGSPAEIVDILVLMYDRFEPEMIARYGRAMGAMIPDPGIRANGYNTPETGANRVDKALIAALHGILVRDGARIAQANAALPPVFEIVASGDGYYKDGSFIQHRDIAYTGSYGVVMIDGLSKLVRLLDGSSWEISSAQVKTLYNWFRYSFEPLMHDGAILDMVRGRAAARQNSDSYTIGRTVMHAFQRISYLLPADQAAEVLGRLKYWYLNDTVLKNTYYGLNIDGIQMVQSLLDDAAIVPAGDRIFHYRFPSMDRVVHKRPDYVFGVSMYSDRIRNYETLNGENVKGWYSGSGMTYLYDKDINPFGDGFWPTVDPLRLPGTTNDGKPKASGRSSQTWVGGASVTGAYGSAGMKFQYEGSGLTGSKSWFMFDNEIVALGSGITAGVSGTYETTVENRRLSAAGTETLTVDGGNRLPLLGSSANFTGVKWAHLAGSGIGYVFPKPTDVSMLREARTGSWAGISAGQSGAAVARNYMTMWIDHGKLPDNAGYAYVLLPNRTSAQTEAYSANPEISVLAQDETVHAVEERTLGIVAANFWKAGSAGAIRAEQPSAVMMRERNGILEAAVSDPTQKQQSVTVVLDKPGYAVQKTDPRIQVLETSPAIKLKVDVAGAAGESIRVFFEKVNGSAGS